MLVEFWVSIISDSLARIFASSIIVVRLSVSSPTIRLWWKARSVRFMYLAFKRWASSFATVVLPTHGVPVMRITMFAMVEVALEEFIFVPLNVNFRRA